MSHGYLNSKVLDHIQLERIAQDEQWGGEKHDDRHQTGDWIAQIDKQCDRIMMLREVAANRRGDYDPKRVKEAKADTQAAFVKIAALAVAALESIQRQEQNI